MAIDFPNSPTNGQEFTSGTTTWVYDGVKWNLKGELPTTNDSMPVGSIMWFAGSVTPTAWLPCDGAAVSRSTYATLFAAIGTTYGVGDGSTTFNVPSVGATTGAYYVRYTTAIGTITTTSLTTAPVGTMLDWPVTSSYPTGWLRADGSAVSRTTYADLFSLLGTTYGSGDGSTTFNLPNLPSAGAGSPVKIIKATLSGVVEPSTVAHAPTHVRLGSDVIDGDRLQVDYTPTGYTSNSAASGAGATTDLTAHLAGIDAAIGGGAFSATGGSVSTSGSYTVHTFTSSGTFVVATGYKQVDILIVGGGGAGGGTHSGGGGGGQVLYVSNHILMPGRYSIIVGSGGTWAGIPMGEPSFFDKLMAYGGGGGGQFPGGGNGAGGTRFIPNLQGYEGGPGFVSAWRGGGGAGAGGNGSDGANATSGGSGLANSITGTSVSYGAGGGGGRDANYGSVSLGGTGGGGSGGNGSTSPTAGTNGRGAGGGGGGMPPYNAGGSGGSGIVIVRYLT